MPERLAMPHMLAGARIEIHTEEEKYNAILQCIPLLTEMQPFVKNQYLEIFELHERPDKWILDVESDWIGFRVPTD